MSKLSGRGAAGSFVVGILVYIVLLLVMRSNVLDGWYIGRFKGFFFLMLLAPASFLGGLSEVLPGWIVFLLISILQGLTYVGLYKLFRFVFNRDASW